MKTVLVVAAHPDDEILGVGGTVARHVAKGDIVYALILGEGQTSRGRHREDIDQNIVDELHKNTLESAKAVGYQEVFFADFPDNRFDHVDLLDIVKEIEQMIERLHPQILYTHYSGDLNIDHQYTARAVLTASRPIGAYCVEEIYALCVRTLQFSASKKSCGYGLSVKNTWHDSRHGAGRGVYAGAECEEAFGLDVLHSCRRKYKDWHGACDALPVSCGGGSRDGLLVSACFYFGG